VKIKDWQTNANPQFLIIYKEFPPCYGIIHVMTIQKVVQKIRIEEQSNDFLYWQMQPYEKRLATLEKIRREYHHWKYDTEPGFQRIYTVAKQ
jgi:hypothetical protein